MKKIDFFSKLEVDFFKVINTDIKNFSLINKMINTGVRKIYISTGMSDLEEIKNCLSRFEVFYKKKVCLVHTQLDHSLNGVNLKSIDVLKSVFNLPVAFGLHCVKPEVLYMSLNYYPEAILFYIKGLEFKQR